MHVSEDGDVTGSINRAKLAELQGGYVDVPAEDIEFSPPALLDAVEAEEQPEDDLDALRAEAEELGVKVDGRWGAERLRAEIEGAQD